MMRFVLLILAFVALSTSAFTPVYKATFVKAAINKRVILKLSNDPETKRTSSDGTFYDDEVSANLGVFYSISLCASTHQQIINILHEKG